MDNSQLTEFIETIRSLLAAGDKITMHQSDDAFIVTLENIDPIFDFPTTTGTGPDIFAALEEAARRVD